MSEVQYPYAYDASGSLVSIRNVSEEKRHIEYRCPCCDARMHPRLGKVRAHCFAHYGGDACSEETYLHRVAKEIIARRVREGGLSLRTRGILTCTDECRFTRCTTKLFLDFDLSEIYDLEPEIERSVDMDGERFVPDVTLYSSQEDYPPVYVEIDVTHSCSENKIQNCPNVIEIPVSDFDDLELLATARLDATVDAKSEDAYPVTLYGTDDIFHSAEGGPDDFVRLERDPICRWTDERREKYRRHEEAMSLMRESRTDTERRMLSRTWRLCRYLSGRETIEQILDGGESKHAEGTEREILVRVREWISQEQAATMFSALLDGDRQDPVSCRDCRCIKHFSNRTLCLIGDNGFGDDEWFDWRKALSCKYFQPVHRSASDIAVEDARIWTPSGGWSDMRSNQGSHSKEGFTSDEP